MAIRPGRRHSDDGVRFAWPLTGICVLIAAILLWLDRPDSRIEPLSEARAGFNDAVLPLLALAGQPLRGLENMGPWWRRQMELAEENRTLRLQAAELRAWRDVALSLQERNRRYEDMLNVHGPDVGARISAWTVADQSTDFVRSRLVAAGREQGVEPGYPAVNIYGLIGRTVDVGARSSRILLLTDFNSRVAVMSDRSNARALLVGDNTDFPRLDYLGRDPDLAEGDRVVTSGDDNVMPRGLPVGEAVRDRDGRWRVALYSRAAPIDLVWIWPFDPVDAPGSALEEGQVPLAGAGDAPTGTDPDPDPDPDPTIVPPAPRTGETAPSAEEGR
ncbi:MAG: rod shape-determining protein MreC [Oceanicaulis sp.]